MLGKDKEKDREIVQCVSGAIINWNSAMYDLCCCINMAMNNPPPISGALLASLHRLPDGWKIKTFKTLCDGNPKYSHFSSTNLIGHSLNEFSEKKRKEESMSTRNVFQYLHRGLEIRNRFGHIIMHRNDESQICVLDIKQTHPFEHDSEPADPEKLRRDVNYIMSVKSYVGIILDKNGRLHRPKQPKP